MVSPAFQRAPLPQERHTEIPAYHSRLTAIIPEKKGLDNPPGLRYSVTDPTKYGNLQGRVKFPTGGEPQGESANAACSAELVRLQHRQYSLDGRRCALVYVRLFSRPENFSGRILLRGDTLERTPGKRQRKPVLPPHLHPHRPGPGGRGPDCGALPAPQAQGLPHSADYPHRHLRRHRHGPAPAGLPPAFPGPQFLSAGLLRAACAAVLLLLRTFCRCGL